MPGRRCVSVGGTDRARRPSLSRSRARRRRRSRSRRARTRASRGLSPTGPWVASYFNNTDLSGAPVLQQHLSSVNFNWGYGSPGTR